MSSKYPRVVPCGDSAVTIEFGDEINTCINERVIALDRAIRQAKIPGVTECVPTYRSLFVHIDPVDAEHEQLLAKFSRLALEARPLIRKSRRWKIPVVYGGDYGQDLEALADRKGMSPERAVELHVESVYRVFMVGFMPGFTYLGGLNPRLATPRRQTPRTHIPGGSISIGGDQSAIGSTPSPSGWHLIGSTPVRCFDPSRDPVFLFEAGDEVEFEPVPPEEWERHAAKYASSDAVPAREG